MTVIVNRRADFTLDNFRRVAFGREGVDIGLLARDAMAAARRGFLALLDSDRTAFIYGITSRPGVEAATAVPPERQREHARLFRAESGYGFGGGCHSEQVVRGMVFARLVDFVEGHGKVRPELAGRVAALLRAPLPCVPLDGQAGPAEVLPLLYLTGWIGDLEFEEGEGLALVNGSPTPPRSSPTPRFGPGTGLPRPRPCSRSRPTRSGRRSRPTTRRSTTSGPTSTRLRRSARSAPTWPAPTPRAASAIRRR